MKRDSFLELITAKAEQMIRAHVSVCGERPTEVQMPFPPLTIEGVRVRFSSMPQHLSSTVTKCLHHDFPEAE